MSDDIDHPHGRLAAAAGLCFPIRVCRSAAGYYVGTMDDEGLPVSRESAEYWPTSDRAVIALRSGLWTQRSAP